MKNTFLILLLTSAFVACNSKKEEKAVVLETAKQKLSYALGADLASSIANAGEVLNLIDLNALATGFKEGLNDEDYSTCQKTIIDAFGMQFSNPDSTKKVVGSTCLGKLDASSIYNLLVEYNQLEKFDVNYLAIGYKDALFKRDSILAQDERATLLTSFKEDLNKIQIQKMAELEKPFFDQAKALENAREIDGGIIIETIKEGTGGSPEVTDNVVAHYILTNTKGDTLESSFDRGQPLDISLQGVIPGWTMSFPQLKKGGEYRLYIPASLAYGPSKGALCFYVELIDFKSPEK